MNAYQLKIRLFVEGIRLSKACMEALPKSRFGRFTIQDYPTTGGLVIRLNDDIYVNAPVQFKNRSSFTLDHEKKGFVLETPDDRLDVSVLFPPRFALDNLKLADGSPVTDFVMSHADRVRLEPVGGCGFHCNFCSMPRDTYSLNNIESIRESLAVALDDPLLKPRHALISGGTPKNHLKDFEHFNAICSFFPQHFPFLDFDLMVAPRTLKPGTHSQKKYRNFLTFVHEARISGLSVNLELFGTQARKTFTPEKNRIGQDNYLIFIEEAVNLFGVGAVRSSLIVGLEPEEGTLKGVEALAARGCLPVLSPFIAAPGTFLAAHPSPDVALLERVAARAREIAERHRLFLGPVCKPCGHNCL